MSQEISLISSFGAGFLSFFAPCILPLVPPYFAWFLGTSQKEIKNKEKRLRILLHSTYLIFGFSLVFIILGASASKLGQILAPNRLIVQKIGGLLIIFFGLSFAGILKIIKNQQTFLAEKLFSKINRKTSSFIVGMVFAFAWVACFSPILGSILVLASFEQTLNQGILLLSFYSLGLAVPFLLSALFIGKIMEKTQFFYKAAKVINMVSAAILIILGLLLLTDNYYRVVALLNQLVK